MVTANHELKFKRPAKADIWVAFGLGLGNDYPTQNKDGDWVCKGHAIIHATAKNYCFVVNKTRGTVIDKGHRFMIMAGDKEIISFQEVVPPKSKFTPAEIKKARKSTRVTVCAQERHDKGPMEFGASYTKGTLDKVIGALAKIRASIPAQYRKSATCEIDSESGYEDSHYASVEVAYDRPETDAEVIARLTEQSIPDAVDRHMKQAKLEQLQAELAHPR